ncbi:hypothetical protein SPRG_03780 [Saprolegnia parasitica CBS 223.65]|uniref:Uncharacterized protein n=1 Tax=Saprolegnia parasitica (strain CBS 223.65) TaxID=695850 RepID=A0A067CRI8_SAPPC|nr:hypothetical protein SPRG_03780 [Saprolegnia parasitica CBS 223.65]KDO31860.1 hypothetical protein SPRG_03780 [Saprolegnia parasitica CBS 223.65]|eukprot:XP_012197738.1 hypothetical protein SPRG_03780 [Saprolegnia parasitica CBS 223.65]
MRAWYKAVSTKYPRIVAGCTASCVLASADVTCQTMLQRDDRGRLDLSRTAGLALFGLVYYGGPCKSLYLYFDKVMGTTPTPRTVLLQTFIDCYIHTPLLLIPSFYYITNAVKGKSVEETTLQLKREWHTASFGSVLFWTPAQILNFWVVPQHSKILFVAGLSFVHKTWLSWLSNRDDHAKVLLLASQKS